MILAPVVAGRKGEQVELFDELRAQGFVRVRIDGTVHELDALPKLAKNAKHTVDVVVDRLKVRADAQAAPRRIVRDRAAPRRRPRHRGGDGQRQGTSLQREVRLPGLRLLAAGARAAAVLVQQPDGRLPDLRRPRRDRLLRPAAASSRTPRSRSRRRDQGLGPAQPVLLPDADQPRGALRLRHRAAVREAARERRRPSCCTARKDKIPFSYLNERGKHVRARAQLRGRDPQPRAALPRDRLDRGARGTRQVPQHAALPGVRRHAPARARRATSRSADARDLRDLRHAAARGRRGFFRDTGPPGREARHRRADRQRDRLAALVPGQRRPRLPVARPHRRHALRRRSAAHPPRHRRSAPA